MFVMTNLKGLKESKVSMNEITLLDWLICKQLVFGDGYFRQSHKQITDETKISRYTHDKIFENFQKIGFLHVKLTEYNDRSYTSFNVNFSSLSDNLDYFFYEDSEIYNKYLDNCSNINQSEDSFKKKEDKVKPSTTRNLVDEILKYFNSKIDEKKSAIKKISIIQGTRLNILEARLKQYSIEQVKEAINNAVTSSFLNGDNKNGWTLSFDWLIKPNNFPKVLEGNYNYNKINKKENENRKTNRNSIDFEATKASDYTEF